jgi:hypothetical protein
MTFTIMLYSLISYPIFALAKGKPYFNNLFWVIYDRLALFKQKGEYWLASADRGVPLLTGIGNMPKNIETNVINPKTTIS